MANQFNTPNSNHSPSLPGHHYPMSKIQHQDGGKYVLQDRIGKGTDSQIWRAKNKECSVIPEDVAVKVYLKEVLTKDRLKLLNRECEIQTRLDHPSIVQLYDIVEDDNSISLVMEFGERGDLLDYINNRDALSEKETAALFLSLVEAIEYTHLAGYAHRDIKLENIFLPKEADRLLLGDWGLATPWSIKKRLKLFGGTLVYAAPEIVCGRPYIGPEVDIWSLGVVLFILVTGRLPFDDSKLHHLNQNEKKEYLRNAISEGAYEIPNELSQDLQRLLASMLCVNVDHRASITEVKYSPWMRKHHPKLEKIFNRKQVQSEKECITSLSRGNDKSTTSGCNIM